MDASLIARINEEPNIHSFISEAKLIDCLQARRHDSVNWMKIFNSKIELSGSFIITHARFIEWDWLIRPLPEAILQIHLNKVVQWNAQLYSQTPRTFDFMAAHRHRFDWRLISVNPPSWFNELHYECFGSMMDWKCLTPRVMNMNLGVLSLYAEKLDWPWISTNSIPGEPFAQMYIGYIHWDSPDLDVSNLSMEFLDKIKCIRELIDTTCIH